MCFKLYDHALRLCALAVFCPPVFVLLLFEVLRPPLFALLRFGGVFVCVCFCCCACDVVLFLLCCERLVACFVFLCCV